MDKIAIAIKKLSLSRALPKVGDNVQRVDKTLYGARANADRQQTWFGIGTQPDLERVSVSNAANSNMSHLKDRRIKSFGS
jgi:hypothetical protein